MQAGAGAEKDVATNRPPLSALDWRQIHAPPPPVCLHSTHTCFPFIFGYHAVYSDKPRGFLEGEVPRNNEEHAALYEEQRNIPGYRRLLEAVPVVGTWDEYDFGLDDGDRLWEHKLDPLAACLLLPPLYLPSLWLPAFLLTQGML